MEVEVEKQLQGPGKRWGHTCNAIKGGRFLYVFGGYGQHNCQTNQVHVFDTGNPILFYFLYYIFRSPLLDFSCHQEIDFNNVDCSCGSDY